MSKEEMEEEDEEKEVEEENKENEEITTTMKSSVAMQLELYWCHGNCFFSEQARRRRRSEQ